jgi:hypothetical protein
LELWDRKVLIVRRELKLVTTHGQVAEKLQWVEELITTLALREDVFDANTFLCTPAAIKRVLLDVLKAREVSLVARAENLVLIDYYQLWP